MVFIFSTLHAGHDPWAQPGAFTSIWNTPIGDWAQYLDSGMQNYHPNSTQIDEESLFRLMDKDPTANLNFPGGDSIWFFPAMKVPYHFTVDPAVGGWNFCTPFVQTNERSVVEFQPTTRTQYGGSPKPPRRILSVRLSGKPSASPREPRMLQ